MAAPRSKRQRLTRQWVTLALIGANLIAMNAILSPWAAARLDLTRDQAFSISPATRRLLGSLDDDLYIYGYFSKRTHPKLAPLVPQIEDLLGEYRAHARRRLHVEIIDPGDNDRVEQEANDRFGVTSTPFRLASKYESGIVNAYFALVIKYGDQYVRYGFDDLIQVEPLPDGDVDVRLRNLEYDLTRAIKKVVYGFRGAGQLFDRLGKPVRLTAVWTPDRLPPQLAGAPEELRKAAKELEKAGSGKFTFEEIVPESPAQQADVERRFERAAAGARAVQLGELLPPVVPHGRRPRRANPARDRARHRGEPARAGRGRAQARGPGISQDGGRRRSGAHAASRGADAAAHAGAQRQPAAARI